MDIDGPESEAERFRQREAELEAIDEEDRKRRAKAPEPEPIPIKPVPLSEIGVGSSRDLTSAVYGTPDEPKPVARPVDVADEARAEAQKIFDEIEAQKLRDKINAEAIEAAQRGDEDLLDSTHVEPQP